MMQRLFFKIFAAVLLSLVAFALAMIFLWSVLRSFREDEHLEQIQAIAAQLVQNALPSASSSVEQQQASLERIAQDLNVNIAVYDPQGRRIAQVGSRLPPLPPPPPPGVLPLSLNDFRPNVIIRKHIKRNSASMARIRLDDGRLVTVRLPRQPDNSWATGFTFAGGLLILLLIVTLIAWPVSRRLTRRLESLYHSVTEWGKGDLSVRAKVLGNDEVATLARGFNQAASRVEQLIQTNQLLLANASHELRTPLARLRMQLELLHVDMRDEKQQKRKLAMVKEIDEFDHMIDGILLGSRLDAQEGLTQVETIDLLALVAEECAHYDGVTVSGDALMLLQGDAHLLRRLVRNLVENALRHGRPPVQVSVSMKNDQLCLDVEDAGDGFGEVDAVRVFEPFFRGNSISGQTKGTGLGLALVQKIVQHHGGSVIIAPSTQGGHVQVVLPITQA